MRPVLFQIPLDRPWDLGPLGIVPGFGFGLVLGLWCLYAVVAGILHFRANGWKIKPNRNCAWAVVNWSVIAIAIVFVAPAVGAYLRVHGSPMFQDGLPIFGYGFMMLIGLIAASLFAERRAKHEGLSADVIWDLVVWLIVPGIIGARLFYLIQYPDRVFGGIPVAQWPFAAINLSQGGIVLYGALLGGAAGYFSFCYIKRIRPLGLADIVVPSVFIGIGFGRIGCLLFGCCYGRPTDLPWGIVFPKNSAAFQSMVDKELIEATAVCTPALHPTQIYSSIDGFMIAAITAWYFWHRRRNGEVLAVALFIYPVTRFCIELLRGDEVGQFGTRLTISQWISICLFLINLLYMFYLSRRPAVREPVVLPNGIGTACSRNTATASR